MSAPGVPGFAVGLFDDAAVFPPGSAPLPAAIDAHMAYRSAWFAAAVGPLVVAEPALPDFRAARCDLAVVVTFPAGPAGLPAVVEAGDLDLRAVEIAPPPDADPDGLVTDIETALAGRAVQAAVELPRDERRDAVLARLVETPHRAKLRTGGGRADLYPNEDELAATIHAVLAAGVPFKATAGLHHAVRNTDPQTGFEQHGFLNVLLAVDAALDGADPTALAGILADRDGPRIAGRIGEWDAERSARARAAFTSFGTCSVEEPLADLADLGLTERTVS